MPATVLLLAGVCPSADSSQGPNGNNGTLVNVTVSSAQGTGNGTVAGSGFSCQMVAGLQSGTCIKSIATSTQVAIAATAAEGSVFKGWSGVCAAAGTTCLFTVSDAATITARFDLLTFALTVASGGGTGNGTVTGSGVSCTITAAAQSGTCAVDFAPPSSVVLTAAAAIGHSFAGWGGACSGTSLTCIVTMSQIRNVTASFTAPVFALTVASGGGSGNGTVTGSGVNCTITALAQSGTCSASFTSGDVATLTAAPAANHTFAGWGGGVCSGTATICVVTMSQARSVTAAFTAPGATFALTVTSGGGNGNGTVAGGGVNCNIVAASQNGTCSVNVNTGTVVTLTATPSANNTFAGWGGGVCTGTLSTCNVTMSQARSVTASFTSSVQTFALTVTSGGGTGSGNIAGSGIDCAITAAAQTNTCTLNFATGTVVTLTQTPSAGHTFAGWGGGVCTGTATTCVVTMSQARSVTASFTAPVSSFLLTVASGNGSGNGTVTGGGLNCAITASSQSGACSASIATNTVVTLTAAPAAGHSFAGWAGGGCSGIALTCQVTMSAARSVTAAFTAPNFTLTITSGSGTGNGTVTTTNISCTITGASQSGTCSASYPSGTQLTLTAAATGGGSFTGWGGGSCAGSSTTCNVTMSQDRGVTAAFDAPIPTFGLSVSAGAGNGEGTVTATGGMSCSVALNGAHVASTTGTCSVNYNSGTNVTLTATPVAGYDWVTWTGPCSGSLTATTCTVSMTQARAVTAKFNSVSVATLNANGFLNGCGTATGCHPMGNTPAATVNFLVGVATTSRQAPFTLATTYPTRVVAYNPTSSYLIYQLQGTAGAYGMPPGGPYVAPGNSFLNQVIGWIKGGALTNPP